VGASRQTVRLPLKEKASRKVASRAARPATACYAEIPVQPCSPRRRRSAANGEIQAPRGPSALRGHSASVPQQTQSSGA